MASFNKPSATGIWSAEQVLSTANPPIATDPPPKTPIPFFHLLERLKTTKREGWRRFAITDGESIADHMYRMAIITMLCPPTLAPRLDLARCTKMALIHDMAEALVGDITPVDGVSKPEKSRREATTMDLIHTRLLGGVDLDGGGAGAGAGAGLRDVWQEYEDGETLEARFVHDVDKVELLLQMVEYEKRRDATVDLGEFARTARKIELDEMKCWCREILDERAQYWISRGREASFLDVEVP